jgi:UDP-N-acetylmuramate--alanine ligase
MVVEADESDQSFLKLSPAFAIITNIDREHMEAYGSFARLVEAFRHFADRVPFYGAVIACADDAAVRALLPGLSRRTIRYGFSDGVDVQGLDPGGDGSSAHCRVRFRAFGPAQPAGEGELVMAVPGRHNLSNALAAVAIGLELGLSFGRIRAALAEFRGAERRYETRGRVGGVHVVDDYGHHPTEIAAVLAAVREGPAGRIIAVFQPHRYSRTRDLLHAFGPSLASADIVVLTDIYPAGEAPVPGVTVEALADVIRPCVPDLHVVPELEAVADHVAALAREGDVVITFGAGSIAGVGDRIVGALRRRGGES